MPIERHEPAAVSGRRAPIGEATAKLFPGFVLETAAITVATLPLTAKDAETVPSVYRDALRRFADEGARGLFGKAVLARLPKAIVRLFQHVDIAAFVEVRYVAPGTDTSTVEAMLDAGLEDASAFAKAKLQDEPQQWLCFHVVRDKVNVGPLPLLLAFQPADDPPRFDGRYLDFDDDTDDGSEWRAMLAKAGALASEVGKNPEGDAHEEAWDRFVQFTEQQPEFKKLVLPDGLLVLYETMPHLVFGPLLQPALDLPGLAPLPWSRLRKNPGRFVSFWNDHPERYYVDVRDPLFKVYRRPLDGGVDLVSTERGFDDWVSHIVLRVLANQDLSSRWEPSGPVGRPVEALDASAFEIEPLWGFDPAFFTSDVAKGVHADVDERWVRPYASNYEPEGDSDLFFARAVLTDRDGRTEEAMTGFVFDEETAVEVEGFTVWSGSGSLHFGLGEENEAVFLIEHELEQLAFAARLPIHFEVHCAGDVLASGDIEATALFDPDEHDDEEQHEEDWEGPSAYGAGAEDEDEEP